MLSGLNAFDEELAQAQQDFPEVRLTSWPSLAQQDRDEELIVTGRLRRLREIVAGQNYNARRLRLLESTLENAPKNLMPRPATIEDSLATIQEFNSQLDALRVKKVPPKDSAPTSGWLTRLQIVGSVLLVTVCVLLVGLVGYFLWVAIPLAARLYKNQPIASASVSPVPATPVVVGVKPFQTPVETQTSVKEKQAFAERVEELRFRSQTPYNGISEEQIKRIQRKINDLKVN